MVGQLVTSGQMHDKVVEIIEEWFGVSGYWGPQDGPRGSVRVRVELKPILEGSTSGRDKFE